IDVRRFRALVRTRGDRATELNALTEGCALYRERPFDDLDDDETAGHRAQLLEQLLHAHTRRLELLLEAGRHDEVVDEGVALAHAHQYDERLCGILMLALYRCGRQADALHAFTDMRSRLVNDLGVEPTAPLQQLERRILEHDASLWPAAVSTPTAAMPSL